MSEWVGGCASKLVSPLVSLCFVSLWVARQLHYLIVRNGTVLCCSTVRSVVCSECSFLACIVVPSLSRYHRFVIIAINGRP